MTSQTTPREAAGVPPARPEPAAAEASTGELVRRLSTQLSELVRSELALARAELQTKGKRAGAGAGMAGAAGVLALYGGGALVAAAVAGLALVLSVWLAALLVGAALLVVAGILALVGRNQIRRAAPPVPQDAVEGVKQDVEAVRQGAHR
jgi:uncharacterized membrane protein YqjE